MSESRAVSTTVLATAFTFGAASLDIGAFTRLGGVFASVMTGNLVLIGLAAARASAALAIHTGVAFAAYCGGVVLSVRIVGHPRTTGPIWPSVVSMMLVLEFTVLAAFAVGWELTGGRPAGAVQLLLLAAAALAMGIQSATMRRLPVNISTTYLTGTLIGVIIALTPARPAHPNPSDYNKSVANWRGLAVLSTAVAGAVGGGILLFVFPAALPGLPLLAIASVISLAATRPVR
jgi:uncharacterized membrane protein YoaK (UPF0700 family)